MKLLPIASQTAGNIVADWRGAPPVEVVSSPADLPIRNAPADARGLYKDGKAWIVANSPVPVGETLAHEVIAHHGLRQTLGSHLKSFFYAVHSGINAGDSTLHRIRSHVRSVYVDDRGQCVLNRASESDEIAAFVAEARFDSKSSRLVIDSPGRKMSKAAANRIAREVLFFDRPADLEEVEGALLIAEHQVRHGGMMFGLGYRLKRWYAAPMTKFDPKARPMSLAESESLLRGARESENFWSEFKFGWMGIGALILLVALPILYLYNFHLALQFIFGLFR